MHSKLVLDYVHVGRSRKVKLQWADAVYLRIGLVDDEKIKKPPMACQFDGSIFISLYI